MWWPLLLFALLALGAAAPLDLLVDLGGPNLGDEPADGPIVAEVVRVEMSRLFRLEPSVTTFNLAFPLFTRSGVLEKPQIAFDTGPQPIVPRRNHALPRAHLCRETARGNALTAGPA
jgi:hypothetical protein